MMTTSRLMAIVALLMLTLTSCATSVSRLYTDPETAEDAGASRLVQVTAIASRQEIVALGEHYKLLLASGISDTELVDGSIVTGRIYCCGGPNEAGTAIWAYVPQNVQVGRGDIIEVQMGYPPVKGTPGIVNTVKTVRQKIGENGTCHWIPENPKLWLRYLYCSWMEQEGWQKREGLYPAWLKPEPNK
jgi:hypothetical protein